MRQIDFKNKTIEEMMDMLLKAIRIKHLHFPIHQSGDPEYISIFMYNEIIEKLKKDNYIRDNMVSAATGYQSHGYVITVEGLLFEGYVNQKTRLRRDKYLQTLALWVTAVGTGIAGLYATGKIIYWLWFHFAIVNATATTK